MGRLKEAFLDDRPYPATPGFKAPGTSQEAARATRGRKQMLCEKVLAAIAGAGVLGLTADQAAAAIGETVLAVRPRVSELATDGRIVKTAMRRKNVSGMSAWVWRAAP